MARLRLTPFVTISEHETEKFFHAFGWEEKTNAKSWDYDVNLSYQRVFEINDKKSIWEHCNLADDAVLSLFAEWSSSLSPYARGRSPEIALQFDDKKNEEIVITLPIQGTDTGGELTIETFIIVHEPGRTQIPGATQPGSILWSDTYESVLESPGSRVPLYVENFKNFPEKFDDPRASWHVEMNPEALEHSASIGLAIYLNSQNKTLVEQLNGTKPTAQSAVLIRMMAFDVHRQLITAALRDDAFTDPGYEFTEGSLGSSLKMMLRNIFRNASLTEINNLFRNEPARFESQLQGALLNIEEILSAELEEQ